MKDKFRIIARLEGISYLLLLGIAMPLKYYAEIPEPVKYLGWAHGILFMLYMVFLAIVFFKYKWSFSKGLMGFLASLLPFGPFVFERMYDKPADDSDLTDNLNTAEQTIL